MKTKIFSYSFALLLSLFVFSPLFNNQALAVTCESGFTADTSNTICLPSGVSRGGPQTASDLILKGVNILLSVAAIIAVLFLIIGGFQYVTSAGNEETAKKARGTITNALIGIAVIVLSYTIVTVVAHTAGSCGGGLFSFGC